MSENLPVELCDLINQEGYKIPSVIGKDRKSKKR